MIKAHPDGIPLKKLAVFYNQTYRQNLTLASLGFTSTASLVASQDGELVVKGQLVFHRTHLPQGGAKAGASAMATGDSHSAKPPKSKSKSGKGPPPATTGATSSHHEPPPSTEMSSRDPFASDVLSSSTHPAPLSPLPTTSTTTEKLTQEQLHQRVKQAIKAHPAAAGSLEQLKNSYVQLFGEALPLEQYKCLYDSWEATRPAKPTVSEQAADPGTALQKKAAATPKEPEKEPKKEPEKEPKKEPTKEPKKEQKQTPPSNSLSESDFPALGAEVKLTKDQTRRLKDEAQKEGNAPVFREAYHAQLKEVHGAHMRAAEALVKEEEDSCYRRRNKALNPDTVNSLVEDVIRDLAAEGELVTKEKVIFRVSMLIQVPYSEAGRVIHRDLPALKDLQYTMREIKMFIESTEAMTSICTLYELGQSLAGLKDKKRYEELDLGPLCRLPQVHRLFKIDSNTKDDDIHQIETVDILKSLRIFRRKQTKQRVDLAEFMQHLADQYSCESPYELGIRIQGLGLPIATLQKVTRCEHGVLEKAQHVIQRELEEEVHDRLRKMKKGVMEPAQGPVLFSSLGSMELRKKYVSMTAAEAVLAVFTNTVEVFNARMTKRVQDFLLQVSGDRLATALFQLAICGGSLAPPQDLVLKDKPSKPTEQMNAVDKPAPPSEATVKQYLADSLSNQNSAITLASMAFLEKKLTKHFNVKEFISLEKGTFLEFLVKNIQLLQEMVGGAVSLGSSNTELQGCSFRPSRQDVFEFIKQCGAVSSNDPDGLSPIECALRAHYGVSNSRDLGCGPLQTLADLVQRQRDMLAGGGPSQVYYESALFARHGSSSASACESVGLLGEMAKAQALASLNTCPLLEDLGQWSQWELVFKPLYGSLKDFIERNAASTDLAALEVSPGVLLRITTSTGDKPFSSAAMTLDPTGTAGHLVSMVVADGITNAPTALLANHMESSLAAAVAKEDLSQAEEDISCYSTVARFLLECLIRIPTRTCQALLQQVFLEPFSRVLGQTKSKAVLLSTARSDPRYLNCLHQLGILLGITDWIKDYQRKLIPPPIQNNTHTAPVDRAKSNLVDSVSSSLSGLNLSEDEYLEDYSCDTSLLNQRQHQADGEEEVEEVEEDEEDQLYELTSLPNGETRSTCETQSEAGRSPEEGESELSDFSDASSQSEDTEDLQRSIIDDIRKSEFGIGVELTAEGQKLMKGHQERLGRSLDRLSTELYSKDAHFVLELIQNADDNSYPSEADVVPALAFVVEKDCVTVLNNEAGFQETNIRAICDVGSSTKGKHKYGYIGQKGIGFKSVFKVTDCPEIHSNGFHLRFDKTCGPMGYILPHWIEDERPLVTQLNGLNQHSWTTKICLPLRSESQQTKNLFHDVHPSLLLFLHRLRSISIYSQSEKPAVTMTRRDLSHNILEVGHTEGTERWLVVKRALQPNKRIKEDVESTELALAFQLGDDVTSGDIRGQPQKQPVFAFLPLRSFGFRFIVQGDFDIPSSREDVDRDSSWNQWLRSEIPQLFLQAMDEFIAHPEFSGLKGLCHFLQFIPLPDEVLDFFKPVAGQIIQLLKGKAFLPTLSSDDDVVYKLPSQVAVCQDAVIREVISGEELDRHLSLAYLHPGLSPAPPMSLLKHLGVRYLKGSDVTTVTTAMVKELMQGEGIISDGGLRRLARLLVCNFRALEYGYGDADILQTLRELPIIPLADGRVVALSGQGVFFPMEKSNTKKKKNHAEIEPFSALYQDVSVVHPSLLNCDEPLESQQVRELLKRLGIHELEPQQLLEQHIYPALRNSSWKSKPEQVVVSYLVFIKQHATSSQEYSDIAVPVLTSRGLLCPAQDRVHFSVEYGNMDLPKKLPGYDWVLLSPCYVETDGDVAGWRELFVRLGVRDRLIIRKERRTLTANELASSPWSLESEQWPRGPGEGSCVLDDYPSEEFHSLATAQLPAALLLEQRQALLELLESNWDTGDQYSQYLKAHLIDSDGRKIKSTKSSFLHFLSRLEWVPAYRLLEGEGQEAKYLCPNSVYLTSSEVHNLLGSHVCYVAARPSEFSRTLGMRHSISLDELVTYLKKWCVKPEPENQEEKPLGEDSVGSEFTSTVQHIHNVYTYLLTNCPQYRLKDLFQHTPAVFIPYSRRDTGWCSGRFYHLKEVCWSDPTAMFQRYRMLTQGPGSTVQEPRVLAPFYSPLEDMRELFTKTLEVELSPNMNQYVGLLELICSSCPIPTVDVLQDVSVIYARLAQKCKVAVSEDQDYYTKSNVNPSYCSTLKGMVLDKRVFPTKDNSWVTLARRPMIADSRELEKIFKTRSEVCLLNMPPADKKTATKVKAGKQQGRAAQGERDDGVPAFNEKDRSLFLEICGVRWLSDCVRTEAQTESLRPCPSMQALVRSVMPYIQKFLYHHDDLGHIYTELLDQRIGERIKRLCFIQVGKLYTHYQLSLTDDEVPVVEVQDVICLLDKKQLFIQKDHLSAKLDICRELAKLFCTESDHRKELVHFLHGLMTSLDEPDALKRFLQTVHIRELPGDEELWEVPAPPKPEPVPTRPPPSVSAAEPPPRPGQEDGEQTLACWPPRASVSNTGSSRTGPHADVAAVEAVMKMWPPPAAPKDRDPEKEGVASRGSGLGIVPQSHSGSREGNQSPRPGDQPGPFRDHGHPSQPGPVAVTTNIPRLSECSDSVGQAAGSSWGEPGEGGTKTAKPSSSAAAPQPPKTDADQPTPHNHVVPEAVMLPSVFQGTGGVGESQRPPLAMDSPLWNRAQRPHATLEDMELTCQRPTTVVFSDDPGDLAVIGAWGEQLVNSFLSHWMGSDAPGRPSQITWCNQDGESGQPYDFKLAFGPAGGDEGEAADRGTAVVYVEVKSTVKREKAFICLSANELDFALKERERYHIFRVYSAGDAQNVRLCRIQNLAQQLHTKDLELFLFV
ncbi:uncharacterized protein ACJ7VT_004679 [Polymixia lowei]